MIVEKIEENKKNLVCSKAIVALLVFFFILFFSVRWFELTEKDPSVCVRR